MLHNLVIETDDIESKSAAWLRELYLSQSLCCICGKPFFQLSKIGDNCKQGPVCGNTCAQKRRRGTQQGTWFLALTLGTGVEWRCYPQTVRDLLNHPQRQQIKGSPEFDVIGWDDTKTAVEPPPVVIEMDDTPPPVTSKDQRIVNAVLSTVEQCKKSGTRCKAANLFSATEQGLHAFDAVVAAFPSMAKAAKALGISSQGMRGRRKRIVDALEGNKMK